MMGFNLDDKVQIINHRHEGLQGKVKTVVTGYVEIEFDSPLPIHIKEGVTEDFRMAFPKNCVKKIS